MIADTGLLQEEWERECNSFAGWRWGCCKVRAGADFGCCWPRGGESLAPHSLSTAGRALGPGRLGGACAIAVGDPGWPFPAGSLPGCSQAPLRLPGPWSAAGGRGCSSLLLSPKASADSWFAPQICCPPRMARSRPCSSCWRLWTSSSIT